MYFDQSQQRRRDVHLPPIVAPLIGQNLAQDIRDTGAETEESSQPHQTRLRLVRLWSAINTTLENSNKKRPQSQTFRVKRT